MPTPSKRAVGVLLAAAAACGAFPLYEEQVWLGSGPPRVTVWTGAFGWPSSEFREVVRVPAFWALPALALAAAAWTATERPRPALYALLLLLSLGLLLRVAGPSLLRNQRAFPGHVVAGPLPLFYGAAAAAGLALIVLLLNASDRYFPRDAERKPLSRGL